MSSKFKVTLVVFGQLSSQGQSGLSLFHYRIAKYFHDKGALNGIICLDFDDNINFEGIKMHALLRTPAFKLLFKGIRKLKTIFPTLPRRLIQEYIFDWHFSQKKSLFATSNFLISTKPVNPKINRMAAKKNNNVVVIATVAHPRFIKDLIARVEEQYNVKDYSSYSQLNRIKRLEECFDKSDFIIPRISSDYVTKTYTSNGIPAEKLVSLRSSNKFMLDYTLYQPKDRPESIDTLKFITAGFMNLKKGLPILVDAWQSLKHQGKLKNCELMVVGDLDKATTKVISEMEKLVDVKLMGHQRNIHLFYQQSDVFIASSVSDLGPRTVQEAMLCGLPVIASSHCGTAQYIQENVNGFKYDPFDQKMLEDRIEWFEVNKEKISEMGKSAATSVKEMPDDFDADLYEFCLMHSKSAGRFS